METLNLVQGSEEWLSARLEHFCASEAPVVMGASKYMTRAQLLDLKAGWKKNPDDNSFRQKLFQRGHEHEDMAREHIELDMMAMIPPVVGAKKIRGIKTLCLSSFDGYSESIPMGWEHKDWNQTLSENVLNNVLEPLYYWQLEHQCMVSGLKQIEFTCSDGSYDKRVSMTYKSQPERQKELKAAWKQFEKDLAEHNIAAKDSVEVEAETFNLPALTASVTGNEISTNIQKVIAEFKSLSQVEMNKELETDLDFVNKDALNKLVKAAREKLAHTKEKVRDKFTSFRDFSIHVDELDAILQKMQADGEKKIKSEKDRRKNAITQKGQEVIDSAISLAHEKVSPLNPKLISWSSESVVWSNVIKNKRTIESIQAAVDNSVAEYKANLDSDLEQIIPNLEWLTIEAKDYSFLFSDVEQFVNQGDMSFKAICKQRISEYKEQEASKKKADLVAEEVPVPKTAEQESEVDQQKTNVGFDMASGNDSTATMVVSGSSKEPITAINSGGFVIKFSDGNEFKIPDLQGHGPMMVVEKISHITRLIVNKYKNQ